MLLAADHWHDVLVGSILGTVLAYFSYRQYYPSLASPLAHRPYSPRVRRAEHDAESTLPVHDKAHSHEGHHTHDSAAHARANDNAVYGAPQGQAMDIGGYPPRGPMMRTASEAAAGYSPVRAVQAGHGGREGSLGGSGSEDGVPRGTVQRGGPEHMEEVWKTGERR